MLHELLLALLGYTGDLITDRRNNLTADNPISDHCTFKLAPDISFIDPSDRELIERIITLGFYYRELERFSAKSRNLNWIRSENVNPLENKENPSVYRRALANGIVEILSIYTSSILHIEQLLLSETMPILATVTQGLNKFFTLLPPLYELILEIERGDIRGGQLLNLLHKKCHCGVPELQTCIQRLLWHGHQVMYNQLASWMVYGILEDRHGEFFISRQEDRNVENNSSHTETSEKMSRLSIADASLTDWHMGFHISLDMLPEYIPMRVAESILFAGKAVRVLRNPSPTFLSRDDVYPQVEDLLPQSEADKIENMLLDLKLSFTLAFLICLKVTIVNFLQESSEFHKRSFECAVDSIQAIAASHLWQLVVVRADLNGHLKALKDYFLLAKGDFFQCFLEESRQLMRLPPRQSTAEADLMVPFQLASLKTIGEEDKYFSKVSLRMPSYGITVKPSLLDVPKATSAAADGISGASLSNASSEMSVDGWHGIALEYSIDWPLHLFFTQEVLSKYLRVFQYLLRLKRTQMELEKLWASVDVIESQWNILQSHIQDSHDFTELVGFHQEYLSALISQTFLDIGSVSRILDGIMKLCLQFCWNIENQDNFSNTSELEHIAEEFNKKSNSLYTILRSSRLAGSQRTPFLRRFLLRLNLNSFFESTAKGVMNVVRPRPTLPGLNQQ
ncbi:hypothetical protein TSUD_36460 [Trifolium subterraneum]|uniref:Gamma-tubulin complex component n=1 Tax=Trifolium subterraneum TaxID=3900 RepID=A0A2Z6P5J7_TRISU|nr:hypothetical protein TSUD_36460 [Trifolium subterraneum]